MAILTLQLDRLPQMQSSVFRRLSCTTIPRPTIQAPHLQATARLPVARPAQAQRWVAQLWSWRLSAQVYCRTCSGDDLVEGQVVEAMHKFNGKIWILSLVYLDTETQI